MDKIQLPNKELRVINTQMELREDGDKEKIGGYGIRYNELSEPIMGLSKEKIAPGAADNAIKNSDIRSLFNHDPNYVLGRKKAGTLNIYEDEIGVRYEADPPDKQWANDLKKNIARGDIDGSSFIFSVAEDGDEWDDSGDIPIRTITEFEEIIDIGPVTFPAYPTATSGVRSNLNVRSAEEIYNQHLKNKGAAPEEIAKRKKALRKVKYSNIKLEV